MNHNTKLKLLVIPHIYTDKVKIRSIEFARNLTDYFDVYCLKWKDLFFINDKAILERWIKKIYFGFLNLLSLLKIEKENSGLIYVNVPYLQPMLFEKCLGYKAAWYMCRIFNTFILMLLVKWLKIEIILLASFAFFFPKNNKLKNYFDIVDWFNDSSVSKNIFQDYKQYISYLKQSAAGIFVVSPDLGQKLAHEYDLKSISLPNGADVNQLRSVLPGDVESIRKQWGLTGKYVIGYIGNHGPFAGIDFVVEMFKELNKEMKDALLFVVGPVDSWTHIVSKIKNDNIIFTGPVNKQNIPAYFNAIDLGLSAKEKSSGTEFAFQLKIVEYTACRKFVISTPLQVWQKLNWPNVILCEMQVNAWIESIKKARSSTWNKEWDKLVEPYDWKALSKGLATVLNS